MLVDGRCYTVPGVATKFSRDLKEPAAGRCPWTAMGAFCLPGTLSNGDGYRSCKSGASTCWVGRTSFPKVACSGPIPFNRAMYLYWTLPGSSLHSRMLAEALGGYYGLATCFERRLELGCVPLGGYGARSFEQRVWARRQSGETRKPKGCSVCSEARPGILSMLRDSYTVSEYQRPRNRADLT